MKKFLTRILGVRTIHDEHGTTLEVPHPLDLARRVALLAILFMELLFISLDLAFRSPSENSPSKTSQGTASQKFPGDFSSHGFTMDCKIEDDSNKGGNPSGEIIILATIRGAMRDDEKLVLKTTYPSGETKDGAEFDKKDLDENFNDFNKEIVGQIFIAQPKPGDYTLTLRSFKLKKDVCKATIRLFWDEVKIKDIQTSFEIAGPKGEKMLKFVVLSLEKRGNIPIRFGHGETHLSELAPTAQKFKKKGATTLNAKYNSVISPVDLKGRDSRDSQWMVGRIHGLTLGTFAVDRFNLGQVVLIPKGAYKIKVDIPYFEGNNKKTLSFEKEVTLN